MSSPASRASQSQKRIFSLYRQLYRVVKGKPVEFQKEMMDYLNSEFRKNALIEKKEFFRIDYFVRRAKKYLDILKSPSVTRLQVSMRTDIDDKKL